MERQGIGADVIIAIAGTNRIEANSSLSGIITFDFNSGNVLAQLTLGYTDDSGASDTYSSQNINVNIRSVCMLRG